MAIPLKTGADLYNNELLRARLHNHPADALDEYGVGSFYFNNSSGLNSSDRMRYRGLTAWHSVANLEDIEDVKDLIKALSGSSSESVASVLGRVITLEGYFSNGKAKDADLLDGHNSDYFAEAATLNDLLEDYEAFKAVFADNSDDYINTWTEVKNFLDGIKNTEDLNAILLGINTELGNKANKATTLAGYGITDGMRVMPWIGSEGVDFNNLTTVGSYGIASVNAHNGPLWYGTLLTMGGDYNYYRSQLAVYEEGQMYVRAKNGNDIWSDWRTILDNKNYSNLITDLNKNLNVPSITIGGIKLSVVEGQLQIEGDAYATGQLSSGGIGSEGSGSGASGIVILEDWEKYDDTLAQVLGAGLGVGLRDKIAALESKATKVSVSGLLESGKSIGTIKVDNTSYNLLAPDDYLPLSGGVIKGSLEKRLPTEGATQNYIIFTRHNGTAQGYLGFNGVDNPIYIPSAANAIYSLLHEGNYESIVGNKFLKLSGGTLTDSVMVNHSSGSKGYLLLTNGASIGGLVTNGTAVELFNVNGYGIGVEGTSDVYVLTNWVKKTMLHEGNFNSYAPTLTGVGASGTWAIDVSKSARFLRQEYLDDLEGTDDLKTSPITGKGLFVGVTGSSAFGDVDAYGSSLFIGYEDYSRVGRFIFRRSDSSGFLFWQTANAGATAWGQKRQIAFIDSNIIGNAASATRLETPRSLWGNSFNGTADINGDIHLAADKGIVASNGYAVLTAPSYLLLGYAQSELGQTTYLDGNDIYFRYGKNHVPAMYVNASGSVGIGNENPLQKLHVAGNILLRNCDSIRFFKSDGTTQVESLTLNSDNEVVLGGDANYYGLNTIVKGYRTIIKAGAYNTSALIIDENCNAAFSSRLLVGGATDDGTSALQVHGDIALRRGISSAIGAPYDANNPTIYNRIIFDGATYGIRYYSGGWTSSVVDSHTFYVGLNNDAALIIKNNKDVHISGNLIVDGQVSSGGVAEAGTGGATGGSGLEKKIFTIPANLESFPCEHGLGTRDISVTIYEEGNDYQQVLADVYLDSTNVARIVFGSATDVAHKVVIIG